MSPPILDISMRLTWIVSFIGMVSYAAQGMWGSALGLLPLVVYALVLVRFYRPKTPNARVNLVMWLLVFAFVAGAVTERPATLGNLAWMVVPPMGATMLLGAKSGLRWLLVVLGVEFLVSRLLLLDLFPTFTPADPVSYQTGRFAIITATAFMFSKQAWEHSTALLAKVRAADEAKSVFLANVSHEIRTPLNGILGMTQVMLQKGPTPSQREDLEVLQRSGSTLLRLINDLLDLTKAERGELPIEAIPFDLGEVLRDLMEFAKASARTPCRLEAPAAGGVLGDPTRVRQVLSNLVSNALKFTERGEVVLRARQQGEGEWLFEVADTGMGMSLETQATLFTPFKQADASIARRFGGTGLGLALARTLVQRMGGTITVESKLGQGTTFRVVLPLPPATVSSSAGELEVPELRGRRVLLVDDNPVNLRVAQALLERTGCEVVSVASGEAALEVAADGKALDVVLMDCHLQGIDGWETTRRLHALPGRASVPVLALTASAAREDVDRCHQAGMVGVLAKPLLFSELCRVLAAYAVPLETVESLDWVV